MVSCFQTEGQDLYIHCEGLLAVASLLCNPHNPSITRLHVMHRWENRNNQYICLILEQILHANRTLEVLDLEDVGINADGMEYLRSGLTGHPCVRKLLLSRNDLGQRGCKTVVRVGCVWSCCRLGGWGSSKALPVPTRDREWMLDSFLNPYPQFCLMVGVRVAGVLGKWGE